MIESHSFLELLNPRGLWGSPTQKGFLIVTPIIVTPPPPDLFMRLVLILVHGFHKKKILIYSVNQKTVENEDDIKAMLKYV